METILHKGCEFQHMPVDDSKLFSKHLSTTYLSMGADTKWKQSNSDLFFSPLDELFPDLIARFRKELQNWAKPSTPARSRS